MKADIDVKLDIPQGVEVKIDGALINVKGPKGEVSRKLLHPKIQISVSEGKVILVSKKSTKREKKMIYTFAAHIKNMIKGSEEPFVYKLKICSTHFPMTATVKGEELSVQNYLGESIPRNLKLKQGVNVKIEGTEITIESPNKELAGQTAASIEKLCVIHNRDRRIFQDGIFITSKAGKDIK